jgi:hypothetical protein
MSKTCKNGHPWTEDNLYTVKSNRGGKPYKQCKACTYDRVTRYNKRHEDLQVSRRYKKKYGITLAEFNQMFVDQGGVCAVCGKPPEPGKKLLVDHDHQTGQVRELLHRTCNFVLGLLKDDPETADAAARYLRKWKRNVDLETKAR